MEFQDPLDKRRLWLLGAGIPTQQPSRVRVQAGRPQAGGPQPEGHSVSGIHTPTICTMVADWGLGCLASDLLLVFLCLAGLGPVPVETHRHLILDSLQKHN